MAPVKTIAVIIAMKAEAAPLVEHLGLKKAEPGPFPGPIPAEVFSGAVGDAIVHVCCNGEAKGFGVDSVGTVPAALTAYQICEHLKPDLLINAGTAGGFKAMGGRHRRRLPRHRVQEPRQEDPHPGIRHLRRRSRRRPPVPRAQDEHRIQARRRLNR